MNKTEAQQKLDSILQDNYIVACYGEGYFGSSQLLQLWIAPKSYFCNDDYRTRAWFEEVANDLRCDALAMDDCGQWTPSRDDYDDEYAWEEACHEAEEDYYTYEGSSWTETVETVKSLRDILDECGEDSSFIYMDTHVDEEIMNGYGYCTKFGDNNPYTKLLCELADFEDDE